MLLSLISDMHLLYDNPIGRIDNAHEVQKSKVREFMDYCCERDMFILQAGDFFDISRHWRLLSSYILFFNEYKNFLNRRGLFCVFGQHDIYMRSEEAKLTTNLGVLSLLGLVKILDNIPKHVSDNIMLYGSSYGDDIPKVRKGDWLNILVVHRKISIEKMYPGDENESAIEFIHRNSMFDLVLCGDSHSRFSYRTDDGRVICNAGCMIRKVSRKEFFDNPWKHEPGFFVYDTEERNVVWQELSHKPIDEVLSRKHLEIASLIDESLEDFVGSLDDPYYGVKEEESFISLLVNFVKKNKADIDDDILDIIAETIDEEVKWK